jgi:hypothetical protein
MNVEAVAGQLGERRARFALSPARSTTGPDTNNVMALAFGVLIVALVVVGSLLITPDLNDNMMPAAELMNPQMQH